MGAVSSQTAVHAVALLLGGMLSGCETAHDAAPTAKLPLQAAIPNAFPRDTTLRLGDPLVQKQLTLSGELAALPFTPDWHNISGGPDTIEAFRAGVLDGGAVGDTPPIHAAFTGLDVKIIAVQMREAPTFKLAVAPGAHVTQLGDLRGKKLAYSPGQAQGALILRTLKHAGIPIDSVQLVELRSTEFKDALGSAQVDVAPLSGPILTRYLNEYQARGATAIAHGVRDNLSFFYVRTAVLEDAHKAAALRAYVRMRARAQLWAAEHPDAWLQAYYVKDQGLHESEGRSLIENAGRPQYPSDWSEAISLTQETIDLLARERGRPSFDAKRLFDLRFQAAVAQLASAQTTRKGMPAR
jgi:sulfonate transport system substrate-binding protein